jgi:dihydroorotate dehydrogenase electron transfer subunit
MRPIHAFILEVREEAPLIKTLSFHLSLDPAPGQYAMVWIRGLDEIPMSFSGEREMTVQIVGDATRALGGLLPGDSIGLRGPLGQGFVLRGDDLLLVGGGVGVAPLAFLGEQAREAGMKVTSLMGFRSSRDVIFKTRFERLGDLLITTDDGSQGIQGRVAAGLKELELEEFSQIYLCGPELMMWDVISRSREHAHKIQACINRYFKCAMGVCGSCCLDPGGIRVCVEGPVVTADRLLESEFGRYRRGPSGGRGLCRS